MKQIIDESLQQIKWLDEKFYTKDNINFYPSVTYILECYPKGFGFNQWLKDLGSNADEVVKRAGEIGSKVHDAINRLLLGNTINWDDKIYSLDEWTYILRFKDFWDTYKPELIATEVSLCSEELGYGGTLDLVCRIEGEIWLIDLKTSNAIYNSYELQIAAYRALWNEIESDNNCIQRTAIFWFKAQTRGIDKSSKKIQGEGWQLKEYTRDWNESYDLFNAVHKIFKHENPNAKPKNLIYPMEIKL